jgi:hypothetical protein
MRRMTRLICSVIAPLALSVSVAQGANVTFLNTRVAFTGAATNLTTINFEGLGPTNAAPDFPNPGGLTASGVNFTTSGTGPFGPGTVFVYGAAIAAQQSNVLNTGTGAILVWGASNQPGTAFLNATLPAGTTAVGMDFWAQQPFVSVIELTVNASDATSQIFTVNTVARPTASFAGFISDVPITSVLLRPPAGQTGLVVDNFSVGQSTVPGPIPQVPEPITALLLGAGLVGIGLVKKRNTLQ